MGLDIYFFEETKDERGEPTSVEIAYFRKEPIVISAVERVLGSKVENCEDYPITGASITKIIESLRDDDWIKETGSKAGFFFGKSLMPGDEGYRESQQSILNELYKVEDLLTNEPDTSINFHCWW